MKGFPRLAEFRIFGLTLCCISLGFVLGVLSEGYSKASYEFQLYWLSETFVDRRETINR